MSGGNPVTEAERETDTGKQRDTHTHRGGRSKIISHSSLCESKTVDQKKAVLSCVIHLYLYALRLQRSPSKKRTYKVECRLLNCKEAAFFSCSLLALLSLKLCEAL